MDPLIPARRLDFMRRRKRSCHLLDFGVPADLREKSKESDKINKYLNLFRELVKRCGNVLPIEIGAFGTVPK